MVNEKKSAITSLYGLKQTNIETYRQTKKNTTVSEFTDLY